MAARPRSRFVFASAFLCSALLIISTSVTGAGAKTPDDPIPAQQGIAPSALFSAPNPTITGSLNVGSLLTAVVGTWSPAPTTVQYRWKRNGVPIANAATASTYRLNPFDLGASITVTVTGLRSGYPATSVTSASGARVALGILSASVPTIAGMPKVGQTLSINLGSWNPLPDSLAYQWKRNGTPIPNASTGAAYKLGPFDLGAAITVTVTGKKTGYAPVTKTSSATGRIAPGTFTATAPYITGTVRIGSTLSAWAGTWSPVPDYRIVTWYRNGQPIPYATGSRYTLTTDDAGAAISVSVTGQKSGFTDLPTWSASRSDWQTTTLSVTVPAWSVFQSCRSVGDSYLPLESSNIWGNGNSVWIYSSGFGDFMGISCGIQLQGKPIEWNIAFNRTWKPDPSASFLFVSTDQNASAASWTADMWFPLRGMDPSGETISTPLSGSSTGGAIYFAIMSDSWASLYIDSITVRYTTIL